MAVKAMKAQKVMKVMKAKQVVKTRGILKVGKEMEAKKAQLSVKKEMTVKKTVPVGKFAKTEAASKRKAEVKANASEPESNEKKIKVKPQDEKTLVAERKIALTGMKLADVEELHKTSALGTEPVKEVIARIKEELNAKQLPDLKALCAKKDFKVGGSKPELVQRLLDDAKEVLKTSMIQALLDFEAKARKEAKEQEAKAREEARLRAVKAREVVTKLKKEVAAQTNDELKEVLTSYGLKTSGSKDEKVDRIVARQREDGKVEKVLAAMACEERKNELLTMDTSALMELFGKNKEVINDRLVKEIIVDRLVSSEAQSAGRT